MDSTSLLDLKQRLAKVKLLALDVDGVMTDGGLYYTDSGEELRKFNVKDGLGIKCLLETSVTVAVITNSTCLATQHRIKKLSIPHYFFGIEDKLTTLEILCEKLSIDLSEVAYMGDDIIDLPVLKVVGCPITVADAMPINQQTALYVTQHGGGQGAVREVCELLLDSHNPSL
jgi:3-deoxy-D-manno-octulosonate 8-phosphate phosphatase (KDO 8-P phosphatase)